MTYGNILEGNTTTVLAGRQEVILFTSRFSLFVFEQVL